MTAKAVSKDEANLLTELTSLDLNNMTPMEALNTLHKLIQSGTRGGIENGTDTCTARSYTK
jgi:hypothetical protein